MPGLQSTIMNSRIAGMGAQLNLPLHHYRDVEPYEMPEQARSLLVHERDMTGTLASFYDSPISLRTLSIHRDDHHLYRRVLLETRDGATVEFGAIRIYLDRFEGEALQAVLSCSTPLGQILTDNAFDFRCDLQGFFRLRSDVELENLFGLEETGTLYGRANHLETRDGRPIADVIEILPPGGEES